MPLRVEGGPRISLGTPQSSGANSARRSRGLADIAPQYVAKSGLCTTTELEGARGTSFRIQHVLNANVPEGTSRFPKLDECAHFHYEHVDIGSLQFRLVDDEEVKSLLQDKETVKHWYVSIVSQGESWMIRRSYTNFCMLDEQLHRCIYDRKFSKLEQLPTLPADNVEEVLSGYLTRLSVVADSVINCGPVLNWFEMDNRGHRLLVPATDSCPINTPAVAAAYTVKKYKAQAPDELSFEVGDMISVIDMPPPEESIWWRGKRGFLVGFFPCECVAVIGEKIPRHIRLNSAISEPSKSVLRKHGKLIAFFRSFILNRPSRRRLRQSGILKERVFGCDLGEHLQNSGHDVPMVLKCCAEFIETHGIVDGIYRLSGVTSNIHKLRNAFDEDRVPALYEDHAILQDIHSVASLLKMYFRELPNPLCTYQLYHQFVDVVQGSYGDDLRLLKMREVVHKLPPPHYRTLDYLMRHLSRVALRGNDTGMTSRNVAIVWAPNLLRCREFEIGGVAALQFVGVQAVVTEFLVCYVDMIFSDKFPVLSIHPQSPTPKKSRPKSLAISTPTKLLSLEQARSRALIKGSEPDYIEVGGGPANLPARYHTVIDLPSRKRTNSKRSPLGWRLLFGSGKTSQSKAEGRRKSSTPSDLALLREKPVTESDLLSSKRRLRPAKSVESLTSLGASSGQVLEVSDNNSKHDISNETDRVVHLRPIDGKPSPHNRAVSHESYFDTLPDQEPDQDTEHDVFDSTLDLSEIQVNFDLEESEMRIFSEDETLIGSGSISFSSPRPQKHNKLLPVSKRLSHARLARPEDSLSSSHSADPSPKKLKTQNDEYVGKSRLEERLSSSVGELQFIDSVSPDQTWVQVEVHPIQSPSPISSLSHFPSSVSPLPSTSPILPHIPHLAQSPPLPPSDSSELTTPDTPQANAYSPLIESPPEPVFPKPEQRKPRPYHPYENVVGIRPRIVETNLDAAERPSSVAYERISTDTSSESLMVDGKQQSDEQCCLVNTINEPEIVNSTPILIDDKEEKIVCNVTVVQEKDYVDNANAGYEDKDSIDDLIIVDKEEIIDKSLADDNLSLTTVSEDAATMTPTREISHLILDEDLSTGDVLSLTRDDEEATLSDDVDQVEMEIEKSSKIVNDNESQTPLAKIDEPFSCFEPKPDISGKLGETNEVEESEPTTESEPSSLQTVICQSSCSDIPLIKSSTDNLDSRGSPDAADPVSEDELNGLSRIFREPVLETSFDVNLPLRSSSSSNVRALLSRFEQDDTATTKGERPRTLERLSTKRCTETLDLSDPERRERIEQYKEKRRTFLREKYRTDMETTRRYPPFEKPPRKHPPPPSPSTVTVTTRSFDSPTVSSLCRNAANTRRFTSFDEVSEKQPKSLDYLLVGAKSNLSPTKSSHSPEHRVTSPRRDPVMTSPRRKSSQHSVTTPPYCIKDMAALFENRENNGNNKSPKAGTHKQYLSSV